MLRKLLFMAISASHKLRARASGVLAVAQPPSPVAAAHAAPRSGTGYAAIALLVPAFFFLYGLNAFPLRDNNEGLYAEIAREMLATGQYIVPHLNGVPYIEKPPLLYWLVSLSMSVLGPTPAAARLVSALSMLALCVVLFQFCRVHGTVRTGCCASVGLASALPVALVSHVVLFDPLLTALLGACLLCFLHSYLTASTAAYRAAAFLLALAVLEKGAVALVLAGGIVGLFLLLMRDRAGARRLFDPPALAILLVAAGSWHLAAALHQPGFGWFYFVNEHLLRFIGRRVPDDYHHGPVWFYLPRILLMMLPWAPLLLLLVRRPGRHGPARRTIVRFCQAAILFPLLFFTLSQAKADYYLLVAAPPLALWLAVEAAPRLDGDDRRLALCWGLAAAIAVMLLVAVPNASMHEWTAMSAGLLALGCVTLAAAGTRFFRQLRSPRARELAMLGVALLAAPTLALVCRAVDQRGARDSSWYVARIIQEQVRPGASVFIYRDFEDIFSTLPFYLGRPVPIVASTSRDLQFGCFAAPGIYCISAGEFLRQHLDGPVAVALQARRAEEFLALTSGQRWRVEWVGDKMVFFNAR
jgi:4-amino-4-deoxy-L-arabinose transferase-like glycosyltransferase